MMFLDYILTSVALGMTFLLGCTGEILTEKAGHLNLGIPEFLPILLLFQDILAEIFDHQILD